MKDNKYLEELAYKFWSIHPKELEPYREFMPEDFKGGVRAWFFFLEMKKLQKNILVGWVPVDENGEPYRSTVSAAYSKGRGATRKNTMKMYSTKARAASYSPVKLSKPIYMEP